MCFLDSRGCFILYLGGECPARPVGPRHPTRQPLPLTRPSLVQIFTLGGLVTFIGEAFHGLGRHMDTVSHANMVQFNIWDFVQTIVAHAVAFTFVKISIAVSLLRLSQSRVFQWVIWPIIAVFLASLIVAFFAFFMRCIPLRAVFDTDIEGNCYPVEQFVQMALANTGMNIATDVLCATLPIPIIWNLQMRLRTRLYLIVIFSMGYLWVHALT
jgi:magnesium-transporting ATPase (P-type)